MGAGQSDLYKGTYGDNPDNIPDEFRSQTWVISRNGVIQNGGINNPPHPWDEMTGLSRNTFRGRKKWIDLNYLH